MGRQKRRNGTARPADAGAGRTEWSRTVALAGHPGAGKTQLAEVLLHTAGVVREPGRVDDLTALLSQASGAEARRGSVVPQAAWLPWRDGVVHLIDTPGHDALSHPARLACAGADTVLLVVSAPDGVEAGAMARLREARAAGQAVFAVVTKVDRHADGEAIRHALADMAGCAVVPLQVPVVEDGILVGLIDVLASRLLRFDPDGTGAFSPEPLPARLAAVAQAARERVDEAVAVTDEALLEAYLEHLELPTEVVWEGLARATARGELVPMLFTSGTRHVGAGPLLDAVHRLGAPPTGHSEGEPKVVAQWVASWLDDEGELVSLLRVWQGELDEHQAVVCPASGVRVKVGKLYQVRGPRRAKARYRGAGALVTTWAPLPGRAGDVFTDGPPSHIKAPAARPSMAWLDVRARGHGRADRLDAALEQLMRLDPSLGVTAHGDGVRLSGTSQRQLDIVVRRLVAHWGVHVDARAAAVSYRERPRRSVSVRAEHRGLADGVDAMLGEVALEVAPASGWCFEPAVAEDVLPARFVLPAGEGARRAALVGPLAGYPVFDVSVRCVGGEYDILSSTEDHFVEAGAAAMRLALLEGGTDLYEPWSQVVVHLPPEEVGVVLSDLGARRARVSDVQVQGRIASIVAQCPDRELMTWGERLECLTHGQGWFESAHGFYDRVPSDLVADAVAHGASHVPDSDLV